jgi:hypothetical protein
VIGPSQRPLPNTQHSQQTDIRASGGIRTRNPSKQAVANPRLRPRGHWDRQPVILDVVFVEIKCKGSVRGKERGAVTGNNSLESSECRIFSFPKPFFFVLGMPCMSSQFHTALLFTPADDGRLESVCLVYITSLVVTDVWLMSLLRVNNHRALGLSHYALKINGVLVTCLAVRIVLLSEIIQLTSPQPFTWGWPYLQYPKPCVVSGALKDG